ncbi:MAG: NADH:ubiquinone oxidoreductase 21kD subunit [Trizodia sp. TS-e1964]|nr:MAG: NADH:ubiquinone oxidoreductase 21kD subunit [Trizodia sp. TS-e1964]
MSLIRRSLIRGSFIQIGASRGLSAPGALRCESTSPGNSKTETTNIAISNSDDSSLTIEVKHNEPNYDTHIDHATSSFSPRVKQIMDGSEDGEVLPAAVLSGAPIELEARTVRIYKPSKPATQSGTWRSHHWLMDWDILQKGHRWENPLMGWQSSADFMQGTVLNFTSKEDAIRFAQKQGYEYIVQEPNVRKIAPKAYANNFLHTFAPLKHIRTK